MNVHDSEKLANLLRHHGWAPTDALAEADLLLVNTCSIRDKAEHQLYSDLGALREWREAAPGRVLAVGGCVAQQAGGAILRRFPLVDFVFATHTRGLGPALAVAARRGEGGLRVEEREGPERFAFPEPHPEHARATPGRAYLTAMEGCDLFCAFCIVPLTRGRELSRPAAAILAEARALARGGVREITLLGQTVNAYGRHDRRRGRSDEAGTLPFAELLARLAAIPGIARIRYTSPHPIFFDDALVRAHGELPALCPHVHLPLQSGSDAVLRRMRRRYGRDAYRRVVDALRCARADLALTTDLIVGFPGETDAEFQETLALVREVAFTDAYSFRYSPRPGTAAAALPDAVPGEVAQARLEELQALLGELTFAAHRARVGERTEVLVAGPSRRGGGQCSGRDPYHRVVNFEATPEQAPPGALVPVRLLAATPHSLQGRLEATPGATPEAAPALKARAGRADELIQIQTARP
jgi:tRNA-2-methylthio-N6-dimethylallyladenosine synthase